MASLKFACVVALVCMALVGAPMVHATITCLEVSNAISPCVPYITNGGDPPESCCDGARALFSAAKSTEDRQATCKCLKHEAASIRGYNDGNAVALPGKCGIDIPYKFSVTTDCSTIKF